MKRGKKSTQFLKGICSWSVLVHEKKMGELEKHMPDSFQVSIHTGLLCLWLEAQIDSFITLG